ncbi:hypothetical protein K438DRAFT_1764820 [Mycena galopus ATCC 62051]|nr:hypothetical protein K438DRAFT_1764820 [Mycena galopus ATCC 62051]
MYLLREILPDKYVAWDAHERWMALTKISRDPYFCTHKLLGLGPISLFGRLRKRDLAEGSVLRHTDGGVIGAKARDARLLERPVVEGKRIKADLLVSMALRQLHKKLEQMVSNRRRSLGHLRGQATLIQAISPPSVQMQLLHGPNLDPWSGLPDTNAAKISIPSKMDTLVNMVEYFSPEIADGNAWESLQEQSF